MFMKDTGLSKNISDLKQYKTELSLSGTNSLPGNVFQALMIAEFQNKNTIFSCKEVTKAFRKPNPVLIVNKFLSYYQI